ncbi:MAG: cytochrome c, partial [bacterium]
MRTKPFTPCHFKTASYFFCGLLFLASFKAEAQTAGSASFKLRQGKALVQSYCLPCHALSVLDDLYLKPKEWRQTVDDMMELGMQIPGEKRKILLEYLISNFSKPGAQQSPKASNTSSLNETSKSAKASAKQQAVNVVQAGKQLFADFGCNNCHTLAGKGGEGLDGPELGNVGAVLSKETIEKKLKNPRSLYASGYKQYYNDNLMP